MVFSLPGVSFSPVSPALTKVRLAGVLLEVIILAAIIAVGAGFGGSKWFLVLEIVPIVLGIWQLWLIPRQVRALMWAITDKELLIRRGIMFRKLTVVPFGRLQFVDLAEGPISRMVGIAEVKLHTASASSDASIPGLPVAEATQLRQHLTRLGRAEMAGL